MAKEVQPAELDQEGTDIPLMDSYRTTRHTTKAWITPQNTYIPLGGWHWEFFRDVAISARYGVTFEAEQPTRLAALRVGFIRVNYEVNGGRLVVETMRWDQPARMAVEALIAANRDSIDNFEIRILSGEGAVIGSVAQTFLALNEGNPVPLDELLMRLNLKPETT
jgi:hypothetical protein